MSKEAKESPTLKDNNVSKCSSGGGKMILSMSTAGEEAITSEEADLAKVAAPAIMKCINTTPKMIEFKMTMWGQMLDITTKESLFVSVSSLMDKVEDLTSQLEAIGEETHTGNPIVLSVLSRTAVSMGLSNVDSRLAEKKTSRESNSDYI